MLLVEKFFIDAAEVLHLERLLLAQAVGDDPQPVAARTAAPAPKFERRQIVAPAVLRPGSCSRADQDLLPRA
jgi:hypothetical protein